MEKYKKLLTYIAIAVMACVGALNYQLLVFPNRFAPAGLGGICTMIQYLGGIRVGYLSLIINLPLALIVYFKVSKPLAVRALLYVVVFSGALVLLDHVDLSAFAYETQNGTSTILGPLAAGIVNGAVYSVLIKAGSHSGGMDFVASLIHKSHPNANLFWIIFSLNIMVACISYFVYGYKLEPVLLCILYSFTTSTVSDKVMKAGRSAVRFEIITQHPQEISEAIVKKLRHTATLLPGKGVYKGMETNVLICIVNKNQTAALSEIVRSVPDTFAVVSQVGEVMGNFKHINDKGQQEFALLDRGDIRV